MDWYLGSEIVNFVSCMLDHIGRHSSSAGQISRAAGSGARVSAVDSEISTCHIAARIAEQESDGAHQIFRSTHLALRDQARPLFR
jgi:hypothetical protein